MTQDIPPGFRLIRLRPAGPRKGQSTESFLRGKAMGDRQWDKVRDQNIGRLVQRRRKPKNNQP